MEAIPMVRARGLSEEMMKHGRNIVQVMSRSKPSTQSPHGAQVMGA
jgi:hypothetical protein